MKKTYIAPSIASIAVPVNTILAGSETPTTGLSGSDPVTTPSGMGAKESLWDDGEE